MTRHRGGASSLRGVAVAVLVAVSAVALHGHIPSEILAGAIGTSAALALAVAILGIGLFVVGRPITARLSDRPVTAPSGQGTATVWIDPQHLMREISANTPFEFVSTATSASLTPAFGSISDAALCLSFNMRALTGSSTR